MEKNLIILAGQEGANLDQFLTKHREFFDNWESIILSKATDVLEMLDNNACDIVLCEASLDDMPAKDLFKTMMEKHPSVVRFIVAENLDSNLIIETEAIVHQYIKKSMETRDLQSVCDKSLGLRRMFSDKNFIERISAIENLPSPPETYNQITNALKSEDVSLRQIADLVSGDIGISTKMLRMVNSAFFGLNNPVENVGHAVNVLGIDAVKSIVLAAGVFNQFKDPGIPGFSIDSIYTSCSEVGARARLIAHVMGFPRGVSEESLMGGMLHDVGKLVMMSAFPDELLASDELSKSKNIPLYLAEREVMNIDDAKIGAYLLSLWGLPESIVEAVAYHCEPSQTADSEVNTLSTVHLAYAFHINDQKNVHLKYVDGEKSSVDLQYVETIGLKDDLQNLYSVSNGAAV